MISLTSLGSFTIVGRGLVFAVENPHQCSDFAHLLNHVVKIDGIPYLVIGVDHFAHRESYRKDERIGLCVKAINVLWVVYGMCGEYSDRSEWNVCAYPTEELAIKHAELAQARADALSREYDSYSDIPPNANEYDSQMSSDYTGTFYRHCMVEVRDELPKI